MSVSKVSGVKIIRRPDFARKDSKEVSEVEISNKDSKLNNNLFNDLIVIAEKKDKKQKEQNKKTPLIEIEKEEPEFDKENPITDFFI